MSSAILVLKSLSVCELLFSDIVLCFMCRWWKEYADRKADEEDEHVADSLLYDRNHLPRAAPPPDSVFEERARLKVLPNGSTIVSQQTVKETIIS